MEITNEIKTIIFAQHFGQVALCEIDGMSVSQRVKIDGDFLSSHGQSVFKNPVLILKPLSDITDEDFKSLAKVCGYIIGKVNRNDRHIWGDYINNGGVHTGTFRLDTEKSIFKAKITATSDVKTCAQDIYSCSALKGFQYLQSKGYDLPQYLLEGKTIQECGLATYLAIYDTLNLL